jgi:peptidyl-prolyl cis-trans isomerase C
MKLYTTISVSLASLLLLAGCGRQTTSKTSVDIVATVDGKPILRATLEAELARMTRSGRTADPGQVLDELIQRERLVARAVRLGLEQDPQVQRSFQTVLITRLKERELEPKLRSLDISDEDIQAAKQTLNKRKVLLPQVRLAALRLQVNPKASAVKRKEAEARLEEAREKAQKLPAETVGFGPLAIDYSDDDTTRYRGGDLGWLETDPSRYHFDEAMLKAGFALKNPGEVSPVIQGKDGLYLIRAVARREATTTVAKPDEVLARHRAQIEKRRALENAFAEDTRRMIPVEVNTVVLEKLAIVQPISNAEAMTTGSPTHASPLANLTYGQLANETKGVQ